MWQSYNNLITLKVGALGIISYFCKNILQIKDER